MQPCPGFLHILPNMVSFELGVAAIPWVRRCWVTNIKILGKPPLLGPFSCLHSVLTWAISIPTILHQQLWGLSAACGSWSRPCANRGDAASKLLVQTDVSMEWYSSTTVNRYWSQLMVKHAYGKNDILHHGQKTTVQCRWIFDREFVGLNNRHLDSTSEKKRKALVNTFYSTNWEAPNAMSLAFQGGQFFANRPGHPWLPKFDHRAQRRAARTPHWFISQRIRCSTRSSSATRHRYGEASMLQNCSPTIHGGINHQLFIHQLEYEPAGSR